MVSIVEFGTLFPAANMQDEHQFRRWLFQSGMAFGDQGFWWPSILGERPQVHEGIDFFCYEDWQGRRHYLTQSLVPALCDGKVVGVCPDFLGHSLFLLPNQRADQRGIFVFAHIDPHVDVGQRVKQGDVVGRVAETEGEVPAHLHVSFLQGDERDLPTELSWPTLLDQQKLRFIRPFLE